MLYSVRSTERSVRRRLTNDLSRARFDRAKRFVEEAKRRAAGGEIAFRMHARWLKFLCRQTPVQKDIWPQQTDFLHHFATVFGLPLTERREFVALALLGQLWREWCFNELMKGPPELLARLMQVMGWEHFDRARRDGAGVILLPVHGQFSRLFRPYLRHRGHDSLEVGITNERLGQKGVLTPAAKRFELARQMHAAKHRLVQGGIACNLPDARQNLDYSRSVAFFGRQRRLAAGFAELALATGAHVLPLALRFSPRGHFVMEFGPPLQVPASQATHDERVDSLVGQYADFLRGEWRRYPWNIHWTHLHYYLELPEIDRRPIPGDRMRAG